MQLQQTLKKKYSFEGKGLHTGRFANMTVCPAPENTGIMFVRTDAENATVAALAENVSNTTRSTTISQNGVSVSTIEHILSALTSHRWVQPSLERESSLTTFARLHIT